MTPELAALLAPVAPADFFRDTWDRRARALPGPAARFAGLYQRGSWWRLSGARDAKAAFRDRAGLQVEIPIDFAQARSLFDAGMTICADVSADPRLAAFLTGFRAGLRLPGGPAFARVYASGDGGGFPLHFDKFHVFVLQLEGRKRWRFSRVPAVPAPLEGGHLDGAGLPVWAGLREGAPIGAEGGARLPAPDPAALESVVLEEGHALYLPPGTWHATEALGPSIAVSVSPPRTSAYELVARVLEERLLARSEWRRDLLAPPDETGAPGRIPASIEGALAARLEELRALAAGLDARLVHRIWRMNAEPAAAEAPPQPPAPAVTRGDRLAHASERALDFLVAPAWETGEEAVYFYAGDTECSFPAGAAVFMAELARHASFRADEAAAWDPALGWDDVRGMLDQLVEAGLLVIVGR